MNKVKAQLVPYSLSVDDRRLSMWVGSTVQRGGGGGGGGGGGIKNWRSSIYLKNPKPFLYVALKNIDTPGIKGLGFRV